MNYIHTKNDNKRSIILSFLIILPLLIFGIYKNGILLFEKHYISYIMIFKPCFLAIIGIFINFLLELIINKNRRLNCSYLSVFILSLFMPVSINIGIYSVVLLISLGIYKLLNKFIVFNNIAFLKLLIIGVLFLIKEYSYLNLAEINGIYAYNIYDFLWGRSIGGVASTSIVFGIIVYFLLSNFTNYKKSMFPISFGVYFIMMFIFKYIFGGINYDILLSSTVILSFILVLPESNSSCYTKYGIIVSSCLVGLLTSIFTLFWKMEGAFIAILIVSVLSKYIDNFFLKYKKNRY